MINDDDDDGDGDDSGGGDDDDVSIVYFNTCHILHKIPKAAIEYHRFRK